MPYELSYFKEAGLYKERIVEEVHFNPGEGRVVIDLLPQRLRESLAEKGGTSHGGDFSRQDSSIITQILNAGYTPADAYATFIASPRGQHAAERKAGHVEDYLSRTIAKAAGFLMSKNVGKLNDSPPTSKNDNNGKGKLQVDFGKKKKEVESGEGVIITMGNDIEAEHSRWLWPKYIPSGKITILAGDPGMGKSTIALDLISRISRGTFLPSGGRTVSGTCLIASAEDAPEDTIIPRLIAAEANLSRVGLIREVKIEGETKYLTFPRDIERMRQAIISKGARVVIIDPLNAFLERGTDTYKDQDIRSVLAPLENIAEETGAAILIIAHLNKKEDSSTLYRVGGSIGFIGAARSVLAVSETKKGERVLYSLKSNLGMKPKALSYETRKVAKTRKMATDWLGEEKIESSGIRWKGEVDFDINEGTTEVVDEKTGEEAIDFLKQVLAESEVATEDIFLEARRAGLMKSQLVKVKPILGIKSIKKRDNKWYWKLGDSV